MCFFAARSSKQRSSFVPKLGKKATNTHKMLETVYANVASSHTHVMSWSGLRDPARDMRTSKMISSELSMVKNPETAAKVPQLLAKDHQIMAEQL